MPEGLEAAYDAILEAFRMERSVKNGWITASTKYYIISSSFAAIKNTTSKEETT